MIKLTPQGRAIFEATRDLSPNEISAIQSIAYEKITTDNFEYVAGLPQRTLSSLIGKEMVKEH